MDLSQELEPQTRIPLHILNAFSWRVTDAFANRLAHEEESVASLAKRGSPMRTLLIGFGVAASFYAFVGVHRIESDQLRIDFSLPLWAFSLALAMILVCGTIVLRQRQRAREWLLREWSKETREDYDSNRAFTILKDLAANERLDPAARNRFFHLRDISILLGKDATSWTIKWFRDLAAHAAVAKPNAC